MNLTASNTVAEREATRLQRALLLNFESASLEFKRLVCGGDTNSEIRENLRNLRNN